MNKTIVVTSMYANPIHPGHIECLFLAKGLGDQLWVIINNDKQAKLKRGVESFQDEGFRMKVVSAIKPVDKVILSVDQDKTVVESLKLVINEIKNKFGDETEIIFAKGGDRFANEIPEADILNENKVKIVDGLGKKTHDSSKIINLINK